VFGFKTFLLEYLTDEQRDQYAKTKMTPKAREATDHFFGKDIDKVHGEIKNDDKSEIHRQIERHLGHDISHDDYIRGSIKDKYGRDVRIGRAVKDNSLRLQFDKDPVRQTGYTNHKTTTVRGTEVAGQTNPTPNAEHPRGHSWKDISCKNVVNGINRRYLKHEIKHGTVVHFVHDQNGQEIYRATLHPHHNEQGHTMYSVDAEYGVSHPKFTEDSHRIAKELSGPYSSGIFTKHPDVYNDNHVTRTVHPAITKQHIVQMVKNFDSQHPDVKRFVARHPDFTSAHITHILKTGNDESRIAALTDVNKIIPQHITMALRDKHNLVRQAAMKSPQATERHLMDAVNNQTDPQSAYMAINHPNATPRVIRAGMSHSNLMTAAAALRKNQNATSKDIDDILSRPEAADNVSITAAVADHPNTRSHHIDKIVDTSTSGNAVAYVLKHPSTSPETLTRVLNKKSNDRAIARVAVVTHPKATAEHIKMAKSDPAWTVREAAYAHPENTASDLHAGFEDPSAYVKKTVVSHKNADKELLTKALNHTDQSWIDETHIHQAALKHRKADESHVAQALQSPNWLTREHAVKHRKATIEQLENAYKNDDSYRVQDAALTALAKKRGEPRHVTHRYYRDKG
jgi:hypothetical protein